MKRILFNLILIFLGLNFSYAQLESNVDLPFYNNYDGANDDVYRIKKQSDGKILLGGLFTQVGSNPFNSLVRLNSDGTIDNSFSIGTGFNGPVYAIAIQTDGKIIVGGSFNQFNGSSAVNIARLNSDGSHDNTFTPWTNAPVRDLAIQNDGKVIVVGEFTSVNGSGANRFIRLLQTGAYDNTLNTSTYYANGTIWCVTINAVGNIQLGGDFSQFGGVGTPKYAVINTSGGIAGNIANPMGIGGGSSVRVIRNMSDGGFLVAGDFGIWRATLSGLVTMPTFAGTINTIEEDGWGRLYVGGTFAGGLARINTSNLIDNTFPVDAGFNGPVHSGVLLGDSIYLTGGSYNTYKNFNVDNAAPICLISNCPPSISTSYITVEECTSYLGPDGNTYTNSGSYNFYTYSSTGCDSLIVADVTIHPYQETYISTEACDAYITGAGTIYTVPGSYSENLTSIHGCDSNVYYMINFIHETIETVTVAGDSLTSDMGNQFMGYEYQWYDCDTDLPISGATEQVFYPASSGDYYVIVSVGPLCDVQSACETIVTSGIDEGWSQVLQLTPNPTNSLLTITVSTPFSAVITSSNGTILNALELAGETTINVSSYAPGVYFIRTAEGQTIKFIKE